MLEAGFTLASLEGEKAKWTKGDDYAVFDRSVYGAQSYHYCPHKGAVGKLYEGEVVDVDALPLPLVAPDIGKVTSKIKGKKTAPRDIGDGFDALNAGAPDEYTISDLRSALSFPKWQNPSDDYETWIGNGIRLASLKDTEYEDDAKALWLEYSARSPANNPDVTEDKWETFTAERSSYRGIFAASQDIGW
ncbi:PriCT-2 domain-containing protein [Serratia marcescens]|nr:PriCT-2 domain-containing protein [Serratia marcescens]